MASLRVWRPRRATLSLGRLDLRLPGAARAAALARAAGVTPVRRLSGGRATIANAGCLCLGWAQPQEAMEEASGRYELLLAVIMEALEELGVRAVRGELDGEWCPGAWSARGAHGKIAGLAQRAIRGGAWSEALIVVAADPARAALAERVHEALEIPWGAAAQGGLDLELPGCTDLHGPLREALARALRRRWPALVDGGAGDAAIEQRARALRAEHVWP